MGETADGEHAQPLSSGELAYLAIISAILTLFGGLMSGLNLGMFSLDKRELEVFVVSGTENQKKWASKVLPLLHREHLLLVTLLLGNAAAMESLPIVLDKMVSPLGAILLSVTMVLLFGEIIPQAICQRHALAVCYIFHLPVYGLMLLLSPIGWPLAKLLDFVLGTAHSGLFRRAQLKAMIDLHGEEQGGELTSDETTIISGTLDLSAKTASSCMTPIEQVHMVPMDEKLDWDTAARVVECGHSRIPVHFPDDKSHVVGLVLVKELLHALMPSKNNPEGEQEATKDDEDHMPPLPKTISTSMMIRTIPKLNKDMPLFEALNYFQTGRSHMALVVDGPTEVREDYPKGHSRFGQHAEQRKAATPGGALHHNAPHSHGQLSPSGSSGNLTNSGHGAAGHRASTTTVPPPQPASSQPDLAGFSQSQGNASRAPGAYDDVKPVALGILTLEDVLEELLQEEIYDEGDVAEELALQTLQAKMKQNAAQASRIAHRIASFGHGVGGAGVLGALAAGATEEEKVRQPHSSSAPNLPDQEVQAGVAQPQAAHAGGGAGHHHLKPPRGVQSERCPHTIAVVVDDGPAAAADAGFRTPGGAPPPAAAA